MKIVQLVIENIKRLSSVLINPDGSCVVVAGRNGQGKSSVLDAIEMAIGGKRGIPAKPVRDGEKEGSIHVELDNGLMVDRVIKADGSTTLKVSSLDGARYQSPQAVLDAFYSQLSLDPLEFATMKPAERLELLRELVGIDFSGLDAERSDTFTGRTIAGRQLKDMQGELAAMRAFSEHPGDEVSVAALLAELTDAEKIAAEKEELLRQASLSESSANLLSNQIEDLKAKLEGLKAERDRESAKAIKVKKKAEKVKVVDLGPIRARIAGAEELNQTAREYRAKEALKQKIKDKQRSIEDWTRRIEEIDDEKRDMIASAKFPIPELGFDGDGVTLAGMPFEQASSAEQLRASVAMGLALNPTLRVLLVRSGSLLDTEALALIAEMAEENDAQIWIERVGTADGVGVIIEDGEVESCS